MRRPGRLHRITFMNLARSAAGDRDCPQVAQAQSVVRIRRDHLGRVGDLASVWRPGRVEAGHCYPAREFARATHDEDAPAKPFGSERNLVAVGEKTGCVSLDDESPVRSIAFCPPTACRKMC